MKQLIITLGLVLLGLGIFRMMVTDKDSLYHLSVKAISDTKEAYLCTI